MKIIFKIIIYSIVSIIALIFTTEILLRITCGKKLSRWSNLPYIPDSTLGYRYVPNAKGVFSNVAFTNEYSVNSLGFSGKDFSMNKKAGCFRIIVIGTSDEDGIHTDGSLNYVFLLRDYLQKYNIDVVNLAIEGRERSMININFIRSECVKYNPDLILYKISEFPFIYKKRYRYTYKDVLIAYAEPNESLDSSKLFIDKYINNSSNTVKLYNWSYAYRYLCKYYIDNKDDNENKIVKYIKEKNILNDRLVTAYVRGTINNLSKKRKSKKELEKYKPIKYSEKESLEVLDSLNRELALKNIKFYVYDDYLSANANKCKKLCSRYNIGYISLDIPYKKEYSFGDKDGHSSSEGHKVIANYFYKVLKDSIIPRNLLAN